MSTPLERAQGWLADPEVTCAEWTIAAALVAVAEALTVAPQTVTAPVCGAQIVVREVEGCAADIVVCRRTAGPCPNRKKNGALIGLRDSALGQCAAIEEESQHG